MATALRSVTGRKAKQEALIDLAHTLGRDKFAARAEKYDREASFPFENYDDMQRAGLLALCVPEAHGGRGADFETYCLVSAELGRWCGATALTFNMHACSALWTGPLADDLEMTAAERAELETLRQEHYRRVVQDGAVYAQPFSEGSAAAAGKAPFGTIAAKVEGGWLHQRQEDLRVALGRRGLLRRAVHRGQAGAQHARHALYRRAEGCAGRCRSSATGTRSACAAPCRAPW